MSIYQLPDIDMQKHLVLSSLLLILKLFQHLQFLITYYGVLVEQSKRAHLQVKRYGGMYTHIDSQLVHLAQLGIVCNLQVFTRQVFQKILKLIELQDVISLCLKQSNTEIEDKVFVSFEQKYLPKFIEEGQVIDSSGEQGQKPVGREHFQH